MTKHKDTLLCHLSDTYRQEQRRIPDGSGNTIVLEYVMCSNCHKTLEKMDFVEM